MGRNEVLRERPDLGPIWDAVARAFPVRIPRAFWERTNPADPHDPLLRQVLPDPAELVVDRNDLLDPVGDLVRSPIPWVVQKHPDRVLLLVTKRCLVTCRYCFRRNIEPTGRRDPTPEEWDTALGYAKNSEAHEVIFSGGDPLAVRDEKLFDAIDRVRPVPVVRIHTRAPIALPSRVTNRLVRGLRSRRPVWVVIHCNHPRELASDVDIALGRLVDAGIPVLNQSVLLRGVNDDVDVQVALCEALVERGVQPYTLHHTDTAAGNAHFRVSVEEGLALYRAVQGRVSGVALPRYVIDPADGNGKLPVEEWARSHDFPGRE